ncbi:MAG: DUF6291 domain-containing protein [Ruminococcus sp.]|nr:DUF6291 domain-containing protein [Ruminococcus sp.]
MAEKNFRTDNKSFMLYKDWEEIFETLGSFEDAGRLIMALFAYAGRGEKPDFDGALKMAFMMISAQIDRDGEKWEETCKKRSEYASKGGQAKAAKRQVKLPKDADTDKETEKDKEKDTDIDTDTVIVIDTEKDLTETPCGETTTTTTYKQSNSFNNAMKPPSLEEVQAYCEGRENGIDAQYFIDYYSARGWKVGRNPMTDWKAVVRNWERRDSKDTKDTKSTPPAPKQEYPAFADSFDIDAFYSYASSYDPEMIRFTDD